MTYLGLLTEDEEKALFLKKVTYHDLIDDQSPEFLEDMKHVLVRPRGNWELDEDVEVKFLLRKDMTPLDRVWAQFVQDLLHS